jgi:hypothetical protein
MSTECMECVAVDGGVRMRTAARRLTFVAPERGLLERIRTAYVDGWSWYARGGSLPATEPGFPVHRITAQQEPMNDVPPRELEIPSFDTGGAGRAR